MRELYCYSINLGFEHCHDGPWSRHAVVVSGATTPWSWASLPGLWFSEGIFWTRDRHCNCFPDDCDHWSRFCVYASTRIPRGEFQLWLTSERRPEPRKP